MPSSTPLDAATILRNVTNVGPVIRAGADRAAAERRVPDDVVAALQEAGVFRLAFPRAWGGPEMNIADQCRLIESIAYHDPSTGWVAMILSDSGHFAAHLEDSIAHALYPDLDLRTAGQLYPNGMAHQVEGGYRVTGRWNFGSGCQHADRIVGGCIIFQDGAPLMEPSGFPRMRVLWFPREAVTIHDTWHTTGMAGTGSHDYSVDEVFVPAGHQFNMLAAAPRPEPLYRYHGFFFANLPAVALGAAQRAIDELRTLASTKVIMPMGTLMKAEYRVQVALAEAEARVGAARAYQFEVLGDIWTALSRGDDPTPQQRARVGLMGVHVIQECRRAVEVVCEVAGSAAIYTASPFDRLLRDVVTLSQHIVGQRKTFQMAGTMLFGDMPGFTFF